MAADVGCWCKECTACQQAKVTSQPSAPVQPVPVQTHRFTHINVARVGPLPVSSGSQSHVDGSTVSLLHNSSCLCRSSDNWLDCQIWYTSLHDHQ